jgi:hypothetical protein
MLVSLLVPSTKLGQLTTGTSNLKKYISTYFLNGALTKVPETGPRSRMMMATRSLRWRTAAQTVPVIDSDDD